MEKQKRWQFWLILAVVVLTLINILPTIFYYSKPLKSPVNEQRAGTVALNIVDRVNSLETESLQWLESFCKLIGVKPESIALDEKDPGIFKVTFKNFHDATTFKQFLPRAGAQIPFIPAQLNVSSQNQGGNNQVNVERNIAVHLSKDDVQSLFHYVPKFDAEGKLSDGYKALVLDRTRELSLSLAGKSRSAQIIQAVAENEQDEEIHPLILSLAQEIVETEQALTLTNPIFKRYLSTLTQTDVKDPKSLVDAFIKKSDSLKQSLQKRLEDKTLAKDESLLISGQVKNLTSAIDILKKSAADYQKPTLPLNQETFAKLLQESQKANPFQIIPLKGLNPFVEAVAIDWNNDKIVVKFYPDVQKIRLSQGKSEKENVLKEKLNQILFNEIARVSRITDETLKTDGDDFAIAISNLQDVQSFLTFDLGFLAQKQLESIKNLIQTGWAPTSIDLNKTNYPIVEWKAFQSQKPEDQKLGLVLFAPSQNNGKDVQGFRNSSLYVIARGMESIIEKGKQAPNAKETLIERKEIASLDAMLRNLGFISYPGSSWGIDKMFAQDRIYELPNYYANLIAATREDFKVLGNQKQAVLDFTDVEQRIITENRIEDRTQEDLVKWKEDYQAAQANIDITRRMEIPAPTKNVYWENFKLTLGKYFRGDDRKVLKWGLDLSGGKTVRIGLKDNTGKDVTDQTDLQQAVNELYTRINKMGVAERTIKIEGNHIILDFPGSQAFSAQELVKASAMYFHIVNEKFARNPTLREPVQKFLQDVWNEAVVTNRKDIESINEIAWYKLGGDQSEALPRSESAKILYSAGLRIANPKIAEPSSAFNDTLSKIAMMKGEDASLWEGHNNPLMIVFFNYALEGSSLTNVNPGYDPTQGNILSFSVKSSFDGNKSGNPQDDFFAWTSQFAKDKVEGTPLAAYSNDDGWRMAVILNERVISSPSLKAPIREGGIISGRFTPREIANLAADLKAGSLSFTPKILSEQNVSPELGKEERFKGISAALLGVCLVAFMMISYYRFAGIVATVAVILNLLIMWGVLQNIDAAITLPGIAGIVLTIGMAVDANVLVFERFREEFRISGRIASAMQAGYKKAFSAIVDSNITTILAAFILTQFDSGPIKGFAITLIIGIISSMFTALFMTRYFFAGWLENSKDKTLTFGEFIGQTNIDFLGKAKPAITISLVLMMIGAGLFYHERENIFGMDFTGGYSLQVELQEKSLNESYRLAAQQALVKAGADPLNVDVRELSKNNSLKIELGIGMEQQGQPFYQMPVTLTEGEFDYEYQKDPRIAWTVQALESAGLKVQSSHLDSLDRDWTMMSGQFSQTMRNNAFWAIGLALLSILIYITIRFEFKFGIAAIIALAHDVVITLGLIAFFRFVGLSVDIDLQVIGAIMTIIGYSLNDTIIVFDRIREDSHILRKLSYSQIINHAINVTLSRTIMTSGTTLIVLIPLVLFGGSSIFGFALVMTVGIFIGTFSSIFIAGPVLLYFHEREEKQLQAKSLT